MSEKFTKVESKTDWERVEQMTDEQIDTSDIPPLDASFFENAEIRMPKPKQTVTIRLDDDVVEWFKAGGKGYQTRINAVLKMYVSSQK